MRCDMCVHGCICQQNCTPPLGKDLSEGNLCSQNDMQMPANQMKKGRKDSAIKAAANRHLAFLLLI